MTEDSMKELATAIILKAIEDWTALDYGNFPCVMIDNTTIMRHEVLWFFKSAWFESLLDLALPTGNPNLIRESLKIS